MSVIPNLNRLIEAIECDEWRPSICSKCEYGYLDTSSDHPIWTCNEIKITEEVLFYLKIYQHLIEENKNE